MERPPQKRPQKTKANKNSWYWEQVTSHADVSGAANTESSLLCTGLTIKDSHMDTLGGSMHKQHNYETSAQMWKQNITQIKI